MSYCHDIFLSAIEELLSVAGGVGKDGLGKHFDSISSSCQELQKLISDSTVFLTPYDIRTSQQVCVCVCVCVCMYGMCGAYDN